MNKRLSYSVICFLLILPKIFGQLNPEIEIDSLTRIIPTLKTVESKAKAYDQLQYFWQFKNLKKSIEIGTFALELARETNDKNLIKSALGNLAFTYMTIGDAEKSIELMLNYLKLCDPNKEDRQSMAYAFLSINYKNQGDYKTALEYIKKSYSFTNNKAIGVDKRGAFGGPINMADLYEKLNKIDSAYIYAKMAYYLVKDKKMPAGGESFAWEAMHIYAKVLHRKNENNLAIKYYKMALKNSNELQDMVGNQTIMLSMANYFTDLQQPDSAIFYAKKSFKIAQENGNLNVISEAGFLLKKLFQTKNLLDESIYYNDLASAAKDSVVNADKTNKIQNMIRRQEESLEFAKAVLRENRRKRNLFFIILGLVFTSILALVFYRNKTKTDKLNRKLNLQNIEIEGFNKNLEQKVIERTTDLQNALDEVKSAFGKGQSTERKRVSADLHDEIGSALSAIAIFSDLSKMKAQKTAPELVNEIEKIGIKSREMIQTMKDTIWTLNEDSSQDICERMYQYANELFLAKNINLIWQLPVNQHFIEMDFNKKRNILLSFKEALNNIVKHSNAQNVTINCVKNEINTILSISDDGKGFEIKDIDNQGNGLKNFYERMKQIGGDAKIVSEVETGTSLTFTFPNA